MTVFFKNGTCESSSPNDEDLLVILIEFFDQRDEVAVPTHNDKGIDMVSRERHFERVECEVDVRAILIATRRQVPLNHLDGVLGHTSAVLARALPIAVGDFCDDFAPLLDSLENSTDIEVPVQCAFDPNFDVVKVHKYRNFKTIFYQ